MTRGVDDRKFPALLFVLATVLVGVQHARADFVVDIMLRSFDNGHGYLLNGSHCSPYFFDGIECNIGLQLCVSTDPNTPCGLVDLKNVTTNANSITFDPYGTYGAWKNPNIGPDNAPQIGDFQGLWLTLTATDVPSNALIDSYTNQKVPTNTQLSQGVVTFVSPTRFIEPTKIVFDYIVRVAPTSPPTTVSGQTEGPTTPTLPPPPRDCDGYTDRVDGVKPILVNGNTVNVFCAYGKQSGSLTVIQSRGASDETSFAVDDVAYQSPLGKAGPDNNFWLGLDNLYALTNTGQPYSLQIDLCCGTVIKKTTIYDNFTVGPSPGYILKATPVNPADGGLGDPANFGLGKVADIGFPFATSNTVEAKTNQMTAVDFCDALYDQKGSSPGGGGPIWTNASGGWWFGNCENNLNGVYLLYEQLVPSTCAVPDQILRTNVVGVEMRVDALPSNSGRIDRISYTRVRMAVYRSDNKPRGLDSSLFCTFDPTATTTTTTTTTTTAASTAAGTDTTGSDTPTAGSVPTGTSTTGSGSTDTSTAGSGSTDTSTVGSGSTATSTVGSGSTDTSTVGSGSTDTTTDISTTST